MFLVFAIISRASTQMFEFYYFWEFNVEATSLFSLIVKEYFLLGSSYFEIGKGKKK